MKKYINLTFAAFLLFALAGCDESEFLPGPVLNIGDAPAITSPADLDEIILLESQAEDPFSVTWTAAEYGFSAATTYTVEVDRAGNDFANAVILGNTTGLTLNSTVAKFNTALFTTLSLPGEVASDVEMRLVAKISPEVQEVYSPVITLRVTPYTIVIVYPQLQVPGSYQGWDPANNNTIIFSAKSDRKFEGFIYFPDPNVEFKYTDGPSWDTNWGDTGADGTLDPGGDNIKLTDAGMYRLRANLNDLTHSFTKTDWGVIGSATPGGWDSDQNMTYDATENKLTITLDLVAGELKFRANDDWAINFGDTDANLSLEYDGSNIAIAEAGNYTVDLILSGAIPTYKIKKN